MAPEQQQKQRSGQQSGRRRKPKSRYGYQMAEKKQLKELYGIRQQALRNYYREAYESDDATDAELISLLERRLDNAVFRAGFAVTRAAARQVVSHGFFLVNGRRVTVASYRLRPTDMVTVKESKRAKSVFSLFPKSLQNVQPPSWIRLRPEEYSFEVTRLPIADEANLGIDIRAIIEFLAR